MALACFQSHGTLPVRDLSYERVHTTHLAPWTQKSPSHLESTTRRPASHYWLSCRPGPSGLGGRGGGGEMSEAAGGALGEHATPPASGRPLASENGAGLQMFLTMKRGY